MSSSSTLSISSRKPPKWAPMKKSAWNAGQLADRAAFDEGAAAGGCPEYSGGSGRRHEPGPSSRAASIRCLRVLDRTVAIGFSERTWQPWRKPASTTARRRSRNDDIEQQIGLEFGERGIEIGEERHIAKLAFLGQLAGGLEVEIDKAGDRDARTPAQASLLSREASLST